MSKLDKRIQSIIKFYSARDYVQANTNKQGKPYKKQRPYSLCSQVMEGIEAAKGSEAEKKAYWLSTVRKYPQVDFDNNEQNWAVKYWRNGGKYNG